MKLASLLVVLMGCCYLCAETVVVPAGETVKAAGRHWKAGTLVKEGAGTLDLTGTTLPEEGLEIREGRVRFAADAKPSAVTVQYLRFWIKDTRPGKQGAPEYAKSGAQFSEFRLFYKGQMLPIPAGTTVEGDDNSVEGRGKGIDGNLNTKCYRGGPFALHFPAPVTFDAYSFATGNDAIGRDPRAWTLEAGFLSRGDIHWVNLSTVTDFSAPLARKKDIGITFPVRLAAALDVTCPVHVAGKGVLVLDRIQQALDVCSGTGLVQLENGARIQFGATSTFAGSVSGAGSAIW